MVDGQGLGVALVEAGVEVEWDQGLGEGVDGGKGVARSRWRSPGHTHRGALALPICVFGAMKREGQGLPLRTTSPSIALWLLPPDR